MQYASFAPPGGVDDFGGDDGLKAQWSQGMSDIFDVAVASVTAYLGQHGGGTCQFYNPVTHGRAQADLPAATAVIPWNGFPKRYDATGPGQAPDYAGAEGPAPAGQARDQDEYLEWFAEKENGKITRVHFTCEAWDYFDFLFDKVPQKVLELYRRYVSPDVMAADLVDGQGAYDRLNVWNTERGAMHLTHRANNLYAEVFLAGTASVRRARNGTELTQSIPLIACARYGDATRNSDPAIGAAVNGLARDGRHIALANPVGLYMGAFNGQGLTLNGQSAGGYFTVVRGAFPRALRAVYALPPALAAQGYTVSDVKSGDQDIAYGGQLAERITMHIYGVGSAAQDIHDPPVNLCGAVPAVQPPAFLAGPAGKRATPPTRA